MMTRIKNRAIFSKIAKKIFHLVKRKQDAWGVNATISWEWYLQMY